jgi:protein-L-isoaspartate(D-aspartate) O-methyltransferase
MSEPPSGGRGARMSATEQEERAQFTLAMRAKGINDLGLLRALERAPRALFMPQRFADISGRDIALPIGCGQTSPPPAIVAAMIAALDLKPSHRACEIGTGTGYCTALLAQLANSILSLERFETLAVEAAARIKTFGLANVAIRWADGFDFHRSGERFDRVMVHGLIEPPGEAFRDLIAPGGVLVAAVAGQERGEQRIVRLAGGAKGALEAADCGPARALRPLERGLARAL